MALRKDIAFVVHRALSLSILLYLMFLGVHTNYISTINHHEYVTVV